MTDKHSHSVRNGIIATVIGGLILSAVPQLRGFVAEAMSWVWEGITWAWTSLISYYSMPGWAILIIGLFALVGLAWLYMALRPQNEPAYRNYTEDMLDGAKWRWSWTGNEISNLWCFCPDCDAQLVYSDNYEGTDFICERCLPDEAYRHYQSQSRVVATVKGGNRYYALGAAEREIRRRIRTNEYIHSKS